MKERKCMICGAEISASMGGGLARDLLLHSLVRRFGIKTHVREICGKCALITDPKKIKGRRWVIVICRLWIVICRLWEMILCLEKMRGELIRMLFEKSFKYGKFKLTSGKESNFYIDCKLTMLHPRGKELIGRLIFEKIRGLGVQAIGGLELGSVPISGAVSLISQLEREPIKEFIVRKEKKGHGIKATIEGDTKQGERVVVVDDVVTTGGSTIKAIMQARAEGLDVVKVVILVDRQEEDGMKNVRKHCPDVEAIITIADIMAVHKTRADNK